MSISPMPAYNSSRHPIETWQDWYLANQYEIERQASNAEYSSDFELRSLAPYEYTNSLNQRQIWEPYLTGRERQEFDSQLRSFMRLNKSAKLRVRPGPMSPPLASRTPSHTPAQLPPPFPRRDDAYEGHPYTLPSPSGASVISATLTSPSSQHLSSVNAPTLPPTHLHSELPSLLSSVTPNNPPSSESSQASQSLSNLASSSGSAPDSRHGSQDQQHPYDNYSTNYPLNQQYPDYTGNPG